MADFFNENIMNEKLNEFLPAGESFIASVKAIAKSMEVRQYFSYVTSLDGETLTRSEEDPSFIYDIQRCKYATHDIYIGITQNYIVFNECELYKHAFFADQAKTNEFEPMEVTEDIKIRDFGHAQLIKNVTEAKVKKGLMGDYKCIVKFNNGSCFNFSIPKKAGVGNGMPNHADYREKIIEKLKSL